MMEVVGIHDLVAKALIFEKSEPRKIEVVK
jgi:hypothetical protein